METADTEYGGIDILVTSAGVLRGPSVRIDDFEAATFDSVIDVNLKGTFFALKHAVPIMKRVGVVLSCVSPLVPGSAVAVPRLLMRPARGVSTGLS